MKITDIKFIHFRGKATWQSDPCGHGHPGPLRDAPMSILVVETDEGLCGYDIPTMYQEPYDGIEIPKWDGTPWNLSAPIKAPGPNAGLERMKSVLIGEDPFSRERIWNKMYKLCRMGGTVGTRLMSQVDNALWDLFGKYCNLPLYKLLGGQREKVAAYGSTMCGDHWEGGLNTPQAYADFAKKLVAHGYPAIKLHTLMDEDWGHNNWVGKPSVDYDIECCEAVRDAVGPDIGLMIDCFHHYDKHDALKLGKAIEKLNFEWFEEPMDEYNVDAYKWLSDNLEIPVLGPETADGKFYTRAHWLKHDVSDLNRCGSGDVGGITPAIKIVHMCECFNMPCEIHGGGPTALGILGAMTIPGKYLERGLLHPFMDYEKTAPWLNSMIDPMDEHGMVSVPKLPGLGVDANWDYINDNLLK